MKIKILTLVIICALNLSVKSQNLISNPSFEALRSPVFPFPVVPWTTSQLSYSFDWWSLAEIGESCDESTLIRSTPDLFKVGVATVHVQGITAHTGSTYAGMSGAELIQQKLSQPLEPGRYKIKLFVKSSGTTLGLVNGHLRPGCFFPMSIDVSPTINIFAFNSKIEYDGSAFGPTIGMVSDMKKNNLQPISSISTPPEAQTMWKEISSEFFIEQNDIQWIGIEGLFNPFSNLSPYTLVDDISLEKIPCASCTDACKPESGCIVAGIANTNACTLEVVKLGSASSLDITITSVNGATQYRNIHIDHPPCRVRFDGRNQSGVDLVSGLYRMTAKIKNGCDVKILTKDFLKSGAWIGPNSDCQLDPIDYNTLSTTSKINPLLVCCPENLNIGENTQITDIATTPGGIIKCLSIGEYLSQQTFYNLPQLNLKAKKEIVINPGISNMRNITFTSPKILIKGSDIKPQILYPNSKFINAIDCPFGLKNDNSDDSAYFLEASSNKNGISVGEILKDNWKKLDDNTETTVTLSPNPNNGEFVVNISDNIDLSDFDIEIIDFSGKKIYNNQKLISYKQLIDISKYANGMYMVKINRNNTLFWSSKIIKTK